MASSTGAPTGWRITCARSASVPRSWWGCASSARPRCWSGCSASSRPVAPICRSIPEYPAERLAFMLTDAGAPVLVTQSALLDGCPAWRPSCGSMPTRPHRAQPTTAPAPALDPHNTAYVIYTSGSTGDRKALLAPWRLRQSAWAYRIDRFGGRTDALLHCLAELRRRDLGDCDCRWRRARASCCRPRNAAAIALARL